MVIDLTPFKSEEVIKIDDTYSFSKEELTGTDIIKLDNVSVKGYLEKNYDKKVLNVTVSGVMVLPCARTLVPTDYPFTIEIDEEIEENLEKTKKTIDILPIIWENILMEIPIRVVNENSKMKTKGEGWELITDNEREVNNSLAKLKDLL